MGRDFALFRRLIVAGAVQCISVLALRSVSAKRGGRRYLPIPNVLGCTWLLLKRFYFFKFAFPIARIEHAVSRECTWFPRRALWLPVWPKEVQFWCAERVVARQHRECVGRARGLTLSQPRSGEFNGAPGRRSWWNRRCARRARRARQGQVRVLGTVAPCPD